MSYFIIFLSDRTLYLLSWIAIVIVNFAMTNSTSLYVYTVFISCLSNLLLCRIQYCFQPLWRSLEISVKYSSSSIQKDASKMKWLVFTHIANKSSHICFLTGLMVLVYVYLLLLVLKAAELSTPSSSVPLWDKCWLSCTWSWHV